MHLLSLHHLRRFASAYFAAYCVLFFRDCASIRFFSDCALAALFLLRCFFLRSPFLINFIDSSSITSIALYYFHSDSLRLLILHFSIFHSISLPLLHLHFRVSLFIFAPFVPLSAVHCYLPSYICSPCISRSFICLVTLLSLAFCVYFFSLDIFVISLRFFLLHFVGILLLDISIVLLGFFLLHLVCVFVSVCRISLFPCSSFLSLCLHALKL